MKEKKEKKEKKKTGVIYKIVIGILICIIAFSLYKIGTIVYEYYVGTKQYSEVQELAGAADFTGALDWEALLEKNKDVKAWLYSKDTVINYPVVQGDDNDYYLYRMVNGEWNGKGSLFIDYRCENPFKDFNTIIYGHRMKDGSMFRSLVEYRDDPEYYAEHKTMDLLTPDSKYKLEIFAAITIPADSDMYRISFDNDADKQSYLDKISEENVLSTDVSVSVDDEIVMMSTCTYEYDDARLVVYGKLVEK